LLGGALACLLGFLALTAVVGMSQRFEALDQIARAFVQRPSYPVLRASMEAASYVGGQPGQMTAVLLGSVLLWRRRRRWRAGLALPVLMAGAGLVQLAAKWAVDRPRPNLDAWGFPSAHVLSLVVLCGYLAYALATSEAQRRWRVLGVIACGTVVGTVAFSRMYLDAHWLSDVLGGFSIGLAYLLGALWLARCWTPAPNAAVDR
jgi:undecaprenyl-diphosphatase